ncbi:unnamed protein product, partial [marine sediment metagenome]
MRDGISIPESADDLPAGFKDGPVSEISLLGNSKQYLSLQALERLENDGIVVRSGLTPTDVQVAMDRFGFGSPRAAKLGLKIMARKLGLEESALVKEVENIIQRRLCIEAVSFLADAGGGALRDAADLWLEEPLPSNGIGLDVKVSLSSPVIGSGAPAKAYLPQAFKRLHTDCILNQAHSVTGAVGAVVGIVSITLEATVTVLEGKKCLLHTPAGKHQFNRLEKALE